MNRGLPFIIFVLFVLIAALAVHIDWTWKRKLSPRGGLFFPSRGAGGTVVPGAGSAKGFYRLRELGSDIEGLRLYEPIANAHSQLSVH
ncbi:MAG: hypothetical protein DME60_13675 [Verrucomicrobia bacterium]|nr:MAG: hypothetical protein DME60_13675 [Verrucomicrobiota bacterium]